MARFPALANDRPTRSAASLLGPVVNAAINMVANVLQKSAGVEGDDRAFERWMTASSAGVERELAAEKSRSDPPSAFSDASRRIPMEVGH